MHRGRGTGKIIWLYGRKLEGGKEKREKNKNERDQNTNKLNKQPTKTRLKGKKEETRLHKFRKNKQTQKR